ncbi:ammonia-forming cytochrome c nitrite reductase subunit c552 [Tessaracoccus sp. MC1756]|uniref:ammonia-forming cytochrome c nitrite reductase subunit c552 n=1 Tax=Tessaracoccus sp. MC1756 TaxID=2760311 RepID=UPI0015FF6761|nr:ammonia-forming cytochrome c nitrite reductase subunit c552 [Tessaracoccus sp. MC1756]MBB1508584.1 ammonia-forming cytochrome c nitrite reductase subunit c552 [Tessaracoccus sp. MC1756]
MSTSAHQPRQKRLWADSGKWIVAIAVVAVVTFGLTALLITIMERQTEAQAPFTKVVELEETTVDPAVWGQNFPVQYQDYLKTAEMGPTKWGGSHPVAQDVDGDPRTEISSSRLEEDPRLVTMWAGYAFATDYRHARGHAYMLEDQRHTLRVQDFDQPGTCLNCHASTVALMDELGDGDRDAGFAKMNSMSYAEVSDMVDHPVSCLDCHDPDTMQLRITRPAFEDGIKALKASEGIEDYDVNRDATAQEMRSYTCAQCHVEYYFEKDTKELVFPWTKGIDIDDIWEYYEEDGHVDWVHKDTDAEMLKAQHPEFDIWSNGIHAASGVSCADCHMPYVRNGAQKVSDHHLQSPLFDANASCGTCHNESGEEMTSRVENIQDRYLHSRNQAFDALVDLIDGITQAQGDGVDAARIAEAQELQKKASFYLDYVYSENSNGFHAPAYIHRILGDSLDASRKGQIVLTGVPVADLEPSDVTRQYEELIAGEDN